MGGPWHKLDIAAASELYLSGASPAEIAKEYGVSSYTVSMKLKRAGVEMRAYGDREKLQGQINAGRERGILIFLAKNGPHVAGEVNHNAWYSLREMERSFLVCRASDYEDPRSFHKWKITGCGRLALAPHFHAFQ